ncbi:hypothetical protein L3X38_018298 [Prunus dulcis]|uniref:Uncharacterized protein n=1 Tax=Prunus dulcis TaxID=3755 RepID=A0AAD4W9G4_PRUDU|nr:hypothetical protein L3X38_018298 [Prunus dulcis]
MSDSQETPSSWSAFRDDREDEDVVEQMYDVTDQMGEGMSIGLGGNFEYRWVSRRVGCNQSGEGDGLGVTMAVAGSGSARNEGGDEVLVSDKGVKVAPGLGEEAGVSVGAEVAKEGWSADEYPSHMTQQKLD